MTQVRAEALECHIIVNSSIVSDDDTLRRLSGQPQLRAVGEYSLDSEGGVSAGHACSWSPAPVPRGVAAGHTHGGHAHDAGKC